MIIKRKHVYIGLILIVTACFALDNRLNKEYRDYKTVKVRDNELIILKRNDYYGILKFENQTLSPQRANYSWILSKNKIIRLEDKSSCTYGHGVTGDDVSKGRLTPVEFGSFKFYWSPKTESLGYVYLNYYPENNEQNGPLFWTISTDKDINASTLIKAESKFQLLSVKKRNVVTWFFKKD